MKPKSITLPEIGLIAGTRVALGIGAGLLLADKLNEGQRKAAGIALLAVGIISTIPLLVEVLTKKNNSFEDESPLIEELRRLPVSN